MPRRKRKPDALPIRADCITDGIAYQLPENDPEWCFLCGMPTLTMFNVQGTSQPMPLCGPCAKAGRRQLEIGE